MAIKATSQVSLTDVTDAYSVTLTSEAYVFMGNNESGAPAGLSCTTQVIAYRGSQQCTNINVGKIQCPTGISAKIENNGTSVPTITFTTTAAITDSCEATIPVTVGDVSFTKVFSFAIATSVDDAKLELYLKKNETGTLKSMIEAIADVINITSKGGLNLSGNRFTLDSTNTKISADGTISTTAILSSGDTITAELKGGGLKFYTTSTTNHVSLEGHGLFIINDAGHEIVQISASTADNAGMWTRNKTNGNVSTFVGSTGDDGHGCVQIFDSSGVPIGTLGINQNAGQLSLGTPDRKIRAILNAAENAGALILTNPLDKQVVDLGINPNGMGGRLSLRNSSGNTCTKLTESKLELFTYKGNTGVNIQCYPANINGGYIEIFKDGSRNILLDGNTGHAHATLFRSSSDMQCNGNSCIYNGNHLLVYNANNSGYTIALRGSDGMGFFRGIEATSNCKFGTTNFVGDGIEIYHDYPHIDFHKNSSNADFTARLIEEVSGSIFLRCLGNGMGWFHAGGYAQDSSKYVKKNIQDIPEDEALKLLKLRPVSFDYKKGDTNRRGLIAEEVMDIYPELVQIPDGYDEDTFEYDEEGPNLVPSLDYSGFIPYLIKMVQIQQKEIKDLKEQVSELSKRLV